jgi:hypothetical protein
VFYKNQLQALSLPFDSCKKSLPAAIDRICRNYQLVNGPLHKTHHQVLDKKHQALHSIALSINFFLLNIQPLVHQNNYRANQRRLHP